MSWFKSPPPWEMVDVIRDIDITTIIWLLYPRLGTFEMVLQNYDAVQKYKCGRADSLHDTSSAFIIFPPVRPSVNITGYALYVVDERKIKN